MIKLPFLTTATELTDPDVQEATKQAVYELNNNLTIPMKILDIEYKPDVNSKDWTAVVVHVEDCADTKEWHSAVVSFLAGTEWKRKLINVTWQKRHNKKYEY